MIDRPEHVDRTEHIGRPAYAPARGPAASRARTIARAGREAFDVLVIGGGITGAGIARDAARRGLAVALLERDDFASGTSSRSSRLVHGGVRYLEHGHLHLVFESSRERRILLHIAPHLVRPLRFTWPVYRGARVPRWKLVAGLLLYDALSLFRNVATHRPLGAAGVRAGEPAVRTDGLLGGATYWDAATDDARLTLATALDAADAGAVVLNHVEVTAIVQRDGRAAGVRARDGRTGAALEIAARVVVNAAGPWSDDVRRFDEPGAADAVRGTKGVHILVRRERLGNRGALTLISPVDGRVMFALPAGDFAIVGTTDTATDTSPDAIRATEADVRYLLESANAFFPGAHLARADVLSAWAGIRPLAAEGFTGSASSASREHALHTSPSGVLSITGGKLTTYRSMAAEVVDAVERALGRTPTPSPTATLPLAGGTLPSLDGAIAAAVALGIAPPIAARLVHAHGSRWRDVWALATATPALAAPLVDGLPYVRAELAWAVLHERAETLGDLLLRRTQVAFETGDAGRTAAPLAAYLVAPLLGWSEADIARELAAYESEVTRIFGVDP